MNSDPREVPRIELIRGHNENSIHVVLNGKLTDIHLETMDRERLTDLVNSVYYTAYHKGRSDMQADIKNLLNVRP